MDTFPQISAGLMGWAAMQRDDGGRMFAPSEQCVAQLKLETQETDAQHAQVAAQQQQQVQTASAASSSALLQRRRGRKPNPLVPFGWTMGTFAFLMLLNYAAHVFTYRSYSIEYARQQARKEPPRKGWTLHYDGATVEAGQWTCALACMVVWNCAAPRCSCGSSCV